MRLLKNSLLIEGHEFLFKLKRRFWILQLRTHQRNYQQFMNLIIIENWKR